MFVRINNKLVNTDQILEVDTTNLEDLMLIVEVRDHGQGLRRERVVGIQALELLMTIRPSVLESRRLRWPKFAWAIHNLVGHPLMQFLAFFRQYELAMRVHDATVPKPLGRK